MSTDIAPADTGLRGIPRARLSSAGLDAVVDGSGGPGAVQEFLHGSAGRDVMAVVQDCLPPGTHPSSLQLVRAKLKPGRALSAWYDVTLPTWTGYPVRRLAATWVTRGATPPGGAPDQEAEAHRRGVAVPFDRLWGATADGRMSVRIAPVDAAFPQLVRLHDPAHLVGTLRAAGCDTYPAGLTVGTVRYRPGQRHVLRVEAGRGAWVFFAKVYRDDTGRQAVAAAERAAQVLGGGGRGAVAALPLGYVAADGVALWPAVPGVPLSGVVATAGAAAAPLVESVGAALRALHDAPDAGPPARYRDARDEAAATIRAAQHIDVLLPAVGTRLRDLAARVVDVASALPSETPRGTHGDFKCDNLLVHGSLVHLLDFDRSGHGDPAADLGKFLADLRWWAGPDAAARGVLHQAFLNGYGEIDPSRLERARCYDVLLQLRLAARRVPIDDPSWAARVTAAVDRAAATLAEATCR